MRSDIYPLQQFSTDFKAIPEVAQKVADFNDLDPRSARRLRLLAEELICMLPPLLIYGDGSFWIENDGSRYELHLYVAPRDKTEYDVEKILSVAKSGRNDAAKGILGKLTVGIEYMLKNRAKLAKDDPYGAMKMGASDYDEDQIWSLGDYRSGLDAEASEPEVKERWDELEKSILASLADDVTVGIIRNKIHIVVKKDFAAH